MQTLHCPLCIDPSLEVKTLLFSIKNKLNKLFNNYTPDFNQKTFKQSKIHLSFSHLINIVFGTKNISKDCNHQKVSRYIKRKLKCDSQTFNQLCERLVSQIGQRNYQLQVLALQFKTLGQTTLKVFQQNRTINRLKNQKIEQIPIKQLTQKAEKNTEEKQQKSNKIDIINHKELQNLPLNLAYSCFFPFGIFIPDYQFNQNQTQ